MSELVVEALGRLVPGGVTGHGLDRGGRVLRWVRAGSGDIPVVFVAGAGETLLDWANILPDLAVHASLVAYDRAGLGGSDPMSPLTVAAQVGDLAALLAQTGPAIVVGHSWGGLLAQLVAFDHPRQVAGLVLVDPSHEEILAALPWTLRVLAATTHRALTPMRAVGLFTRIARSMATALASRSTDDEQVRRLLIDAYLSSYATRAQVAVIGAENRVADRSVRQVRAKRASSSLPAVPVVALSATRKPPHLRDRSATLTGAVVAAAGGRHVIVDGAGHYIHHDRPDVVIAEIRSLIDATAGTAKAHRAQTIHPVPRQSCGSHRANGEMSSRQGPSGR
ncbi:MAG TPA: alpha/beta hydrolase [Jiangellales bacterium]|nr:alpha/beta hydrolase [Jiangellales bacterium]